MNTKILLFSAIVIFFNFMIPGFYWWLETRVSEKWKQWWYSHGAEDTHLNMEGSSRVFKLYITSGVVGVIAIAILAIVFEETPESAWVLFLMGLLAFAPAAGAGTYEKKFLLRNPRFLKYSPDQLRSKD